MPKSDTQPRLAKRFARSKSGNIAMMFGLALIPLITAVGGAVDFSTAFLAEQRLGNALDAAALAVGAMQSADEQVLENAAESYFAANYPDDVIGTPSNLSVTIQGETVTIDASTRVDTAMLGIVGIDTLTVHATTQVTRESNALEIALVLDNTGSMGNSGKIQALKSASHALTDILFGEETDHPKLKIGLVPFSQAVNVGTNNAGASWLDTNVLSSIHGENFKKTDGAFQNVWDLYDDLTDKNWNGCVETRPEPMDMDDTSPDPSDGDTLWVPYFYPDEPGNRGSAWSSYYNSYLDDDTSGTASKRQKNVTKYDGANAWGSGPHYGCDIPPITPLTSLKATVTDAIEDFVASGYTHIPIGLAWGLRVLSPGAPFSEGVSYGTDDTTKALVLLTDGYNTIPYEDNTHNKSRYTAYGFVKKGRLGTTNYNNAVNRLDPKTETVCDNIKQEGIRLYTITFQLPNGSIKDLMRDCATEPSLYFDSPSNEQLTTVFKAIARDLSNLRISR